MCRWSMADWSEKALRSILLMERPRRVMLFMRNPENPLFWILSTWQFSSRMFLNKKNYNTPVFDDRYGYLSTFDNAKAKKHNLKLGMHRISSRIVRPFLYPVSDRIPVLVMASRISDYWKAGYPAKYAGRALQTDARNFLLLENANDQLFKVVYNEDQNVFLTQNWFSTF